MKRTPLKNLTRNLKQLQELTPAKEDTDALWSSIWSLVGMLSRKERDERTACKEIPESGGHIESENCWCNPRVEHHPGGTLTIHNKANDC